MSLDSLKPHVTNKTWLLAFLLTLLALVYGIFEVWTEQELISEKKLSEISNTSLEKAQRNFHTFESQFTAESEEVVTSVQNILNASPERIHQVVEEASQEFDFWGISVFKNDSLWIWSGFSENAHYRPNSKASASLTLERKNNVTFFSYKSFFTDKAPDTTDYSIIIRKKIEQKNILPIGNSSELKAQQLFVSNTSYPVRFSFFDVPVAEPMQSATLSTQSSDSVGLAYTVQEDLNIFQNMLQNQYFIYRAIFYVFIILIFTLFLVSISQELETWKSLLLKLVALSVAWLFFVNIEYGIGWVQAFDVLQAESFTTLEILITYCIHSFFIFLFCLICYKPIIKTEIKQKDRSAFKLGILYYFFGISSALLCYFYVLETYTIILQTSIPVLDLEVLPKVPTLMFYISCGLFGISSSALLIIVGWFILKLRINTFFPPLFYSILGFFSCLLILWVSNVGEFHSGWIIFIAAIFYLTILIFITISHLNPTFFKFASQLRLLLLFTYITVSLSYVAIYKGYSDRLNKQMHEAAQLFISEQSSQAEQIARSLLTTLEKSLSGLSQDDLKERPEFVNSLFTQVTQQQIISEWERFSISTQLINNSGEIIGEFSSELDSPAWTNAFNMFSLIIPFETEQIRLQNLRPIIRERPLNEVNSNYSTFRRGWIPLYDNDLKKIIGWILTSVYIERPQFEKPLRSVLAFEGNNKWSASINITEYVDGLSGRTNIVGLPLELPANLRISNKLIHKTQQSEDSTFNRITQLGDLKVRELFIADAENSIIRTAARHPGFDNHLFSLIRFFFSVFGAGLLGFGVFFWKREINIFGQSKRFRDRLIDRFILASLICLMALMATTYYAISDQTREGVQDLLLNKLSNLTEAITLHESRSVEPSPIPLNQLSTTLDTDAAIYDNQNLAVSTTSQIYTQHLLPGLIPWDVYQSIMLEGNRQVTQKVTLGQQQLLIGYQPWLNKNSEIAGIVSIPTFLNAPKFNEQLLSTTSYLIGLYVIIFSLFILGAALISTRLTSPLEAIREGLRRITSGDLETTLPVKSQDEIGALTSAYNVMVYRLQDLQDELARAEREAAWKEMAQQVAHEIKNPLTPMKLNLQHLERQLKESREDFGEMKPKIETIAANLIEQIESLNKIASDFSNFAKPTQQAFANVEINDLVQSIASLYETEKKLQVRTNFHPTELWVSGVKDEIRRALINLVKNASEAISDHGIVTLSTSIKQEMVCIAVEDDGEGISVENPDQIFVPNFSTKSSGTGLGLAITKKIVSEHNGNIYFSSEAGVGTIFFVELPLLDR
jgi:signal transduction histidine kinase